MECGVRLRNSTRIACRRIRKGYATRCGLAARRAWVLSVLPGAPKAATSRRTPYPRRHASSIMLEIVAECSGSCGTQSPAEVRSVFQSVREPRCQDRDTLSRGRTTRTLRLTSLSVQAAMHQCLPPARTPHQLALLDNVRRVIPLQFVLGSSTVNSGVTDSGEDVVTSHSVRISHSDVPPNRFLVAATICCA